MHEVYRWRVSAVRFAMACAFATALLAMPGTARAQSCIGTCSGPAPGGSCYCDPSCVQYGDCCSDYQTYCAATGPTCQTQCNSGSDCGFACSVGDGTTSWCGHYSCYLPERLESAPAPRPVTTSSCRAACTATGTESTCASYLCTSSTRPSFVLAPDPSDPCTTSSSGATSNVTCAKNTDVKRLGGSALGMDGWGYYSSRLAIDSATAQAGVRARFYIAGHGIGTATNPALDAYALVRPIATDCKNGQTGVYLRFNGAVVWQKSINKTCMTVPTKLTELPGKTFARESPSTTTPTPPRPSSTIEQIPGAKVSFHYSVHGIGATISAEARAKLQYTSAIKLSTRQALATLTPEAVGTIAGSGGVSISAFGVGAGIGIRAQTSVVDYALPNTLELTTPDTSNNLALHYNMAYQRKPNNWELKAYLKVFFWLGSKTWTHKLGGGTWGGESTPTTLIDRSWNTGFDGLNPLLCSQHEQNYKNTWPTCGDGVCNGTESACTCSSDCGACTSFQCGDGICSPGETCFPDCGSQCENPRQILCDPAEGL